MYIEFDIVINKNTMHTPYLKLQKTVIAGISLLVLLTSCGNNSTIDKNTATDSTVIKK